MVKMRSRGKRDALSPCPTPYLVFQHGADGKTQTFCSSFSRGDHESDGLVKSFRQLKGNMIAACNHGWLILTDSRTLTSWCLWDPVSLEQIQLPQLHGGVERFGCTLTAPPGGEAECIVLITYKEKAIFCKPGDAAWTEQDIGCQLTELAVSEGVIYGLDCQFRLFDIVVDTSIKSVRSNSWDEELAPPTSPWCMRQAKYLIDLCGELFLVVICYPENLEDLCLMIKAVTVLKLDIERKVWLEVKNLRDHAIFLGFNCSISCPDPDLGGAEKNCVYFTRETGDPNIFCYRVEDKSLTASLPRMKLPQRWEGQSWVLPRQRTTQHAQEQINGTLEHMSEKQYLHNRRCTSEVLSRVIVQPDCGTLLSKFQELPIDMLESLAGNLNISDYLNFRMVCNIFREAAPLLKASWRENNTSSSPWLMFLKNDDPICNLVDPMHNSTCFMNLPSHLVGANIAFSNTEGVILHRGNSSFHFYHPFTKVCGELPPCDGMELIDSPAFTSFPTSSHSVTVGILNCACYINICLFYSIDRKWRKWCFLYDDTSFLPNYCNPVYRNGSFYFLDQYGNLGVFKPTKDGLFDDDLIEDDLVETMEDGRSWEIFSRPQRLHKSPYENYLVECDGELLAVFLSRFGKRVQIFRLNDLSRKWIRVDDLSNHTLFLSRNSSFCIAAPSVEMGNRIYFHRCHGQGVLYYSLDTRRYHSLGSDESFDDLYSSREMMDATWIFPSW